MGTCEDNGKSDTATKNLQEKISRQIEYYFGDHNLRRDKFLKEALKEDEGWVPLDTLLKFNRLKTLSTDKEFIVDAVNKSPNQLVEVHEDKTKIRRSVLKPLSDDSEINFKAEPRSIYSKGFPQDTGLDDILEFFDTFGPVENVFMRRFRTDKKFKGSVFTLFKDEETAEKFVNGKDICFKGIPLIKETSKHYYERKAKEVKKGKKKHQDKEENAEEKPANKNQEAKFEMKKDCILHLTGFKGDISREDIKEVFDDHAKVAWVDFSRGDTEAWIRFQEEGMAPIAFEKAKEANDGKIEIKNTEITTRLVSGDEEVEYWNKIKELMQKFKGRKNQRFGQNSRGRGGRGGRFGRDAGQSKRKRYAHGDDDDEKKTEKPKIKKFESDNEENSKNGDPEVKKEAKSEVEGKKEAKSELEGKNGSKSEPEVGQKRKLESEESDKPTKAAKTEDCE